MDALLGRLSCRAREAGEGGRKQDYHAFATVTGPSLHVIIVDSVIEADHDAADEPVVRRVRRRTTIWKPWKTDSTARVCKRVAPPNPRGGVHRCDSGVSQELPLASPPGPGGGTPRELLQYVRRGLRRIACGRLAGWQAIEAL